MSDLKVFTLCSGSSGNSVYVASPGARILIDAGRAYSSIVRALQAVGGDEGRIDAVFVTHGHSDHIAALATLMRRLRVPVHMTEDTAADLRIRCGFSADTIVTHPREYSCTVGDLTVSSFVTSHDSPGSVGYTVALGGADTLGIATDLGCVTDAVFTRLSACSRVIIESNYDDALLAAGPYPYHLKKRIRSADGHLSNADCARTVAALAEAGVGSFLLSHLSEQNNTPELALAACCAALEKAGRTDVSIYAADRFLPTRFE